MQLMLPFAPEPSHPDGDTSPAPLSMWKELVEQVIENHPAGVERLYQVLTKAIRSWVIKQAGSEVEDIIHDVFLTVLENVRSGELRNPETLVGYIRAIARRRIFIYIGQAQKARAQESLDTVTVRDRRRDPERAMLASQETFRMQWAMESLTEPQREVVRRFYMNEEPKESICASMGLTLTQFRLMKSRAKAKLTEVARRGPSRENLCRVAVAAGA